MEILQTKSSAYRQAIIDLYVEAFSSGHSEQYIDLDYLQQYIDLILREGYALLAIDNHEVTGAILICPLAFDKAVPALISQSFDLKKCLYVAEMMVSEKKRGQGIGKKLIEAFFESADKSLYSDAFIRVWDENIPALRLYEQAGFKAIAKIEQTKTKADRSGSFVMNKIYLQRKID